MEESKVTIVLYTEKYKEELESLLLNMSYELFGSGTASLEDFVNQHWAIYLAIKANKVIGLSSFMYNTYFGLRPPTIGNTYLYILPEHRKGRVAYLLSIQAGYISNNLQLPLEHYYASEESKKLSRKLNGTKVYETFIYEVEEVNRVYNNLKSKIKIEE